jgi:hypothetical protein
MMGKSLMVNLKLLIRLNRLEVRVIFLILVGLMLGRVVL